MVNSLTKIQPLLDSAMKKLFRKMQSPDHCLHTLLPPLNDIGTEDIILSCPDVYLICINDLSPLTVCLNLLICEQVFFYIRLYCQL